jgi:hypothetical protein
MKRKSKPIACLLIGTMLSACAPTVEWRYYAPFRVAGPERFVTPVDPAEVHFAGVASKLHYISMTIDGVFFRNLKGTFKKQVALGIDLSGAIDKQDIKTVSEPVEVTGNQGYIFFERPFSIDPFLYNGKPLRLTLTFRDVTPQEALNLKGRLSALGLSGVAAKIIPGATEKLEQHANQFEAFLGKAHKGKIYSYTFSLYPSDMEGVRQDLVVTGGRHVFIAIPAKQSPKFIKKVQPADLAYKLRLAGRRLEWRHDNSEYNDSPYLLLSIIRYKRYPGEDTPLKKAEKNIDQLIEQSNWKLARTNLPNIGTALLSEKSITQLERNLETAWRDVREARIDAGEAATGGNKDAQLTALLKQVKLLGYIGKDFQQILEPAEVKDILFQTKRLARQVGELAAELQKPEADVASMKKVSDEALASIKPPVEPPANPTLTLKPPDVVTVTTQVPTPFYKTWWFYLTMITGGLAVASLTGYGVAKLLNNDRPEGATIFFNPNAQGLSLPRR